MRFLRLFLVLLVLGSAVFAQSSTGPAVTSVKRLKKLGILVTRTPLDTPSASARIEIDTTAQSLDADFQRTEFIVAKESVAPESVAASDGGSTPPSRKLTSTKARSVFLVRGKEIPFAYVAIDFSLHQPNAAAQPLRYLLPVSMIEEEEPEP